MRLTTFAETVVQPYPVGKPQDPTPTEAAEALKGPGLDAAPARPWTTGSNV
ncbi:hypothetical protein ABT300_29365 [Streptomyces sp. NPDC001027]|uniref:hypothetical protein n=1 Tax=Streptomyces sp. NPDC001027 TaxID=3154771 RepID=UPI003321B433